MKMVMKFIPGYFNKDDGGPRRLCSLFYEDVKGIPQVALTLADWIYLSREKFTVVRKVQIFFSSVFGAEGD